MNGGEKRVVAKSISSAQPKTSNRELWATVCYHYPQYTLEEASKLSMRDIKLLLRIAEKINAKDKFELTQIVAAPHTKKGSGVKKLTDYFQKQMN